MHLSNILVTTATLAVLAFGGPIAERQAAQKLRISKTPWYSHVCDDPLLILTSATR